MTGISLRTDGPHSPDHTKEVADLLAECVRYLNHATRPGQDGMRYPADADRLLGAAGTAAGRLPQLFQQVASFLKEQAASGTLEDAQGRDPELLAEQAEIWLDAAAGRALDMARSLGRACNSISLLSAKEDDDDLR